MHFPINFFSYKKVFAGRGTKFLFSSSVYLEFLVINYPIIIGSTFIVSQYIDDLNYSRTMNKIEYFEPNEVVLLKKSVYVKSDLMYQLSERYLSLSRCSFDHR